MRQREGETASERHQNKIDIGSTEACRFYEIWIVPRSIKSVGGPPLELDARQVQHVRLECWRLSCIMCCAHDMGPIKGSAAGNVGYVGTTSLDVLDVPDDKESGQQRLDDVVESGKAQSLGA